MPALIFLFILMAVVLGIYSHQAEKKRREEIRQFAAARQLSFYPEPDHQFPEHFRAFDNLRRGSNRYARNRMQGQVNGHQLLICEYHYQQSSGTGKDRRTTHYWFTLVMLRPDFRLKELAVRREGFFDKMKGAFGWDDIDYSSAEFSREFFVSAPDRDWAFAVIQPDTMDLLLRTPRDVGLIMQQGWLMVAVPRSMKLERLEDLIRLGTRLLDGIPDFCKERV